MSEKLCNKCRSVRISTMEQCPWCYREKKHDLEQQSSSVREKLNQITGRLRAVTDRDGWTCWLCNQAVDPYDLGVHRASVDHVLPRSMGGGNELPNLKLAHQSCNGYRSGTKTQPFAPFDNRWPADHARRENLQCQS